MDMNIKEILGENSEIPETLSGLDHLKKTVPANPICFMHGLTPAFRKGQALEDGLTVAQGDASAEYHADNQTWVVVSGSDKNTKAVLDAITQRLERMKASDTLPEAVQETGEAPVITTEANIFS